MTKPTWHPDLLQLLTAAFVQVFGRRQRRSNHRHGGRRPKTAKARNRVGRYWPGSAAGERRRKGYGDLSTQRDAECRRFATGIQFDRKYNLDVTARILLNGDFTFCPICSFNDLSGAR